MSTISPFDSNQTKCLELLAAGVTPDQVASALGVSVSLISQYCSEELFASELASRRFHLLQKHNARDDELDSLEDSLILQLKRLAPLAMRPLEAGRLLQIVNAAKRRGISAPAAITESQTVVRLTIPTQIVNKFSVNLNNQVISTDAQELVTIQSGSVLTLADRAKENEKLSQQLERTKQILGLGLNIKLPKKLDKELYEYERNSLFLPTSDKIHDFGFT